ncbi:MAG: ribosome recycling factor [Buchnera aphidicola (Eriosoma harunire)]
MIHDLKKNTKIKMNQCVESFKKNISKIRTGRAFHEILDSVFIDYFGVKQMLKNISSISILDSKTLKIDLFDKSISSIVQKSILNADLGVSVSMLGDIIHVIFPVLTEERRKKFIKLVRIDSENFKIAIRNIRRVSNEQIKKLLKNNIISKDIEYRTQLEIQSLTDECIKIIDRITYDKEEQLMLI